MTAESPDRGYDTGMVWLGTSELDASAGKSLEGIPVGGFERVEDWQGSATLDCSPPSFPLLLHYPPELPREQLVAAAVDLARAIYHEDVRQGGRGFQLDIPSCRMAKGWLLLVLMALHVPDAEARFTHLAVLLGKALPPQLPTRPTSEQSKVFQDIAQRLEETAEASADAPTLGRLLNSCANGNGVTVACALRHAG